MPLHISSPRIVEAAGTKPKTIEEYFGLANTALDTLSIARMKSPAGWTEPAQTPEFDEYTVVLQGILRVKTIEGYTDVKAGQAIVVSAGEWVQYSTPHDEGAEYIAVCLPAFSPERVHREEVVDFKAFTEEQVKELAAQLRKPSGKEGLKTGAWMSEGNESLIRQVYRQMKRYPSESVLEIGFGNGRYNQILLTENENRFMAGIDYSEEMVSIAMKNNIHDIQRGAMELQIASTDHIPYPASTFDQVCSSNTIYFWDKPAEVLKEIHRVLKPSGLLALGYRPKTSVEQLPFTKYGFTLYGESDVEALLQAHGFTVIDTITTPDTPLHAACTCARKI